jgi:hypothetical protein
MQLIHGFFDVNCARKSMRSDAGRAANIEQHFLSGWHSVGAKYRNEYATQHS